MEATTLMDQIAAMKAKSTEARIGMLNGDERYLAPRDKGPQRRFARDFVDSKFSAGELLLPVVFVSVLVTSIEDMRVQFGVLVGLWSYMTLVGLHSLLIAVHADRLLIFLFWIYLPAHVLSLVLAKIAEVSDAD